MYNQQAYDNDTIKSEQLRNKFETTFNNEDSARRIVQELLNVCSEMNYMPENGYKPHLVIPDLAKFREVIKQAMADDQITIQLDTSVRAIYSFASELIFVDKENGKKAYLRPTDGMVTEHAPDPQNPSQIKENFFLMVPGWANAQSFASMVDLIVRQLEK